MFITTQMIAICLAFPDVCKVLIIVPVPIPLVNIALTTMAIPTIVNQFIMAMPPHNLLTMIPLSSGDEPGLTGGGGVVSNMAIGPCRYMLGSFKVFSEAIPMAKMLMPTGQNGMILNMVGLTLTPSQLKSMALS